MERMSDETDGTGCFLGIVALLAAVSCLAYFHGPRDEVSSERHEHVAFLLDRDPGLRQVVADALSDGRIQHHEYFAILAESDQHDRNAAASKLRQEVSR